MLIFPDGYSGVSSGTGIGNINTIDKESLPMSESIPDDIWAMMESSGVLFLPYVGIRDRNLIYPIGLDDEILGTYWSSTPDGKDYAYPLAAYFLGVADNRAPRELGLPLRLVFELK